MLDFRQLGANFDHCRAQLARRPRFDPKVLDGVADLLQTRSKAITETQDLQTKKNVQATEMQRIFKTGSDAEKAAVREEQKALSARIKVLEEEVQRLEETLSRFMLEIPNLPHPSVPDGADESANVEVRRWGEKPEFDFPPRDHVEVGVERLRMLDFERAVKLAGSRFVVEYDDLALMERALASFMLDVHVREHGYREVAVPYLVNSSALLGTGQLPKFEADQFRVPFSDTTDFWLVPTAEVPVTNLYQDTILTPDDGPLPHAYCCHTQCFRKEAGAAGRDTRGMIRVHQFSKVELVRFVLPERSYEEHELLVSHAETILQRLGLHYRVSLLCAGDLSTNASKCYDLEVWLPSQNTYREISSCSNFEDFQARRARIRFRRDRKAKAELLHTLNGSGLAIGRTMVAILENYQDKDGGVRIPEALRPYMGGRARIEPRA